MHKILIIRFRRLGDAVLSSAICTTLKQSIPNAEIHYVLNESIAPLFKHHKDIDKIISFSNTDTHSFFRYLKKIRKIVKTERYDIIIDARSTINTCLFSLLSMRTKYRIGLKKPYTRFIYNYRITENKTGYIENKLLLTDPLNKEFKIVKNPEFKLYCTDEEKTSFRDYMSLAGIDFSKPVVLCTVATRLVHKRWPIERMKEVISRIISVYDAQLIFNYSGEEETAFARRLYKELDNDPHVFIDIEAKSIRALMAMICNVDFLFGNEGGPRHLSQALGVPSFAIFPPDISISNWLPNRSERYNGITPDEIDPALVSDHRISYAEKLDLITADRVWLELSPMLDRYLVNNS